MAFVSQLAVAKMRHILVRNRASFLCQSTVKDLTAFKRQMRKICTSVKPCLSKQFNCVRSQLHEERAGLFYTSSRVWQNNNNFKKKRYILHDTEEEVRILAHTHSDIGWGVRLAAENGYLSWMRNTYIMTLVGVAMINSEVAPLSPVAGSGVFLVAGLNMLVGSLGFIYNLHKLKKEEHILRLGAAVCQVLICIHLILWCSILLVFLPDLEKVEDTLEKELKDA